MRLNLQLVCQDAASLPALLASLKNQSWRDWRLYLLDDAASTDERAAIAAAVQASGLPATVVRPESRLGFLHGHNTLFETTGRESEAVVVLHADAVLSPQYVERCLNYFEVDRRCAAAAGLELASPLAPGAKPHKTEDVPQTPDAAPMYRVTAVQAVSPDGKLFETAVRPKEAHRRLSALFQTAGWTSAVVRGAAVNHPQTCQDRSVELAVAGSVANPNPSAPAVQVAVVIVAYNRLDEACLSSLSAALAKTPLHVEVIVVDNASTAFDLRERVGRHLPQARIFRRSANRGFGDSCNYGAAQSSAEHYFFLNPDTVLHEPDILDRLYAYMQAHPQAGILAPKILYLDGRLQETCRRFPAWYMPLVQRTSLKHTPFGRRYAAAFSMNDFDHASERVVDWVQGSAMFIRGEAWRRLGGFDRRFFMYFEDIDLCRRAHHAGYRVVYLPATSLLHAYAKESAKIPGLFNNLLRNRVARFHIVSWFKYLWKWKAAPLPETADRSSLSLAA